MKYCPKCNWSDCDPKHKVCWKDGTELLPYPTCPTCDKEASPANNFCQYCGKSILPSGISNPREKPDAESSYKD